MRVHALFQGRLGQENDMLERLLPAAMFHRVYRTQSLGPYGVPPGERRLATATVTAMTVVVRSIVYIRTECEMR
jgi:hypothetical protein